MSSNKKEWAVALEVILSLAGFPFALLVPFAVWYLFFGNTHVPFLGKLAVFAIACIETVIFIFAGSVLDAMLVIFVKNKTARNCMAFIFMALVIVFLNSFWLKDVPLLVALSVTACVVLLIYAKLVEGKYTQLLDEEKS